MTPPLPEGRDLDVGELRSLVAWLAERPELWRAHVRHDAGRRTFHRLVADDHVTVWLICWMPGHDTGFHDHDGSAGAVAVVDGQIAEQRLRLLEPPRTTVYEARDVVDFGPAEIHRVRHFGTVPAVTVHAYSPVLTRMGAYVTGADGRLLRHALDERAQLTAQS